MEEQEQANASYKISDYNTAGFINIRLDKLWNSANTNSQKGNFHGWKFALDAIYRELTRDFKKGSEEEKEYEGLNTKLKKLFPLAKPIVASFNPGTGIPEKRKDEQYDLLHEMDIVLKRLENKVGKGSRYADEDEDDLD